VREPRAISRSADTRVPLGLLTLAFALTVLSISWFGWLTFSLVGALFVVACSFAVWLFAVRSLRSWHADRDTAILDRLEAVKSLRELNEELETRVGQRTAELQSVNHELRVRNELFDQLAENITDVFWVRSPDSRELRYSARPSSESGADPWQVSTRIPKHGRRSSWRRIGNAFRASSPGSRRTYRVSTSRIESSGRTARSGGCTSAPSRLGEPRVS
jgi:hypothetical protein